SRSLIWSKEKENQEPTRLRLESASLSNLAATSGTILPHSRPVTMFLKGRVIRGRKTGPTGEEGEVRGGGPRGSCIRAPQNQKPEPRRVHVGMLRASLWGSGRMHDLAAGAAGQRWLETLL